MAEHGPQIDKTIVAEANGNSEPASFFPALIIWMFPTCVLWGTVFSAIALSYIFKAFGGQAAEYITPQIVLVATFIVSHGLLFRMFAVKRLSPKYFLALAIVWILTLLFGGMTEGAISSAINKGLNIANGHAVSNKP